MVLAVSLIQVMPDREKAAYRTLKDVNGVKSIYHLFGDHDLLLILETECLNSLRDVLNYIKEMEFVRTVKTMVEAPPNGTREDDGIMRNSMISYIGPEPCQSAH